MLDYRIERIESTYLQDNLIGDPATREILTFIPSGLKKKPILLIELAGLNWRPTTSNKFGQIVNKLFSSGKLKNSIIINPNFKTKIYVNQYLNSSILGKYEDFIVHEIIPFFKEKYDVGAVGLFGKSSGGFGAYSLAVRHPDLINGFAMHFGDSCFEYMYLHDFLCTVKLFRSISVKKWLEDVLNGKEISDNEICAANVIGSGYFYSENIDSEIYADLPIDLETGAIDRDIWDRWLSFDPAKNVTNYQSELNKIKAIYLDVGNKDEYNLFVGMNALHKKLSKMGIPHEFDEFNGGHFGNSNRYEFSLPFLEEKLIETVK
jgi:S-formylglutathione hydrolase FrmB